MQGRLDKIMDMVLFRYGSTGVWQVIQSAVKCMNPTIIYPVTSYATVMDLKSLLINAEQIPCVSIEAADGRLLSEEDELENNGIVKINSRTNVE